MKIRRLFPISITPDKKKCKEFMPDYFLSGWSLKQTGIFT